MFFNLCALLFILGFLLFMCSGCNGLRLPSNRISGQFGGVPFSIDSQKQLAIEGFAMSVTNSNMVATVKINKLSSTNDPQVIDKASAGRVAELQAIKGIIESGGAAVGNVAGKGAHTAITGQ